MEDYRMLTIDSSSQNSGWALYLGGKLKESGRISITEKNEDSIDKMGRSLTELLDNVRPGTIVVELTVVDRGTATQRMLSEIIGVIRGWAIGHKYDDGIDTEFVEYRPTVWRKLVCEENETAPRKRNECKKWAVKKIQKKYNKTVSDDEAEAILLGEARINEINKILNENK